MLYLMMSVMTTRDAMRALFDDAGDDLRYIKLSAVAVLTYFYTIDGVVMLLGEELSSKDLITTARIYAHTILLYLI